MKEIGLFALALFAGTLGYGMVWYSMVWYVRTKGYVNGKRVPKFSARHFLDGLHKVLASIFFVICTPCELPNKLLVIQLSRTQNIVF
jgi:hypothetical protein